MTPTALKEAARVGIPRDKIVGNLVLCSEQSMVPAGEAAIGFICASFWARGNTSRSFRTSHYVYARGKGRAGRRCRHGALEPGRAGRRVTTEAIRRAMRNSATSP